MTDSVRAPLKIELSSTVGKAAALGGALMALFSSTGVILAVQLIRGDDTAPSSVSPEQAMGFAALIAIGGPFLLAGFIIGVGQLIAGARRLLQPTLEADGPEPFLDYQGELMAGLKEGKLTFFGSLSARLRVLFGRNIVALPSTTCWIVTQNGNALIRRFFTTAFSGLILLGVLYFEGDPGLILPLGLLIVGSAGQGAVEYFTSKWLVPTSPPLARSHHTTRHYKAFGHHTHLFARLPILAESLALPGSPNKFYRWGEQEKGGIVKDVGEFSGVVFIERQPEALPTEASKSGEFLLLAGWLLRLAAIALTVFLFTAPGQDVVSTSWAPFVVFLTLMVAVRFFAKGSKFKSQALTLLESLRFRSIATLVEVSGEIARAEVRVGDGAADSFSSASLTARSNFTGQIWSGELISEARSLEARRRLLQVRATDESLIWLTTIQDGIESLREERVRPTGVEISSVEAKELARANEEAFSRRLEAYRGAPPEVMVNPPPQGGPLELAVSDGPSEKAEFKECPECAERVRAKATKCRFCGHRFEDTPAS